MRKISVILALTVLSGCAAPSINVSKLKQNTQNHAKGSANAVKEQTGLDLGTAPATKRKGIGRLTSAPIDP